jgi:2-polyprenyl-6-methoxyphenol hydroxylase-like FAD-dependent oxidoreductase
MQTKVLIVGAGPTGLSLALWLTRLGIAVRIIDENAGPGETSRAFFVQARTLEQYDQIGIADAACSRGHKITVMNAHRHGGKTVRVQFGDFGRGLSPFPFELILLQDQHEKLLIDHLAESGVTVERDTALIDLEDRGADVVTRLRLPSTALEACPVAYVCGCDGLHSSVRELVGTPFDGVSDEAIFYVADVEASGRFVDGEMHYLLATDGLLRIFPLTGGNRVRLIGLVPRSISQESMQIGFGEVADTIWRESGLRPWAVEWFSTYRVQHRIAAAFRKGRTFLLGDAAHVWAPAFSQGLNTGAGDAANLAWKLAWVLKGRAAPSLLDTYQPERKSVSQRVGKLADTGFLLQSGASVIRNYGRDALAALAPALMRSRSFRRWVFMTVSQVGLGYRGGPLSVGRAGRLAGGDRLPWIEIEGGGDNFTLLRSLDWHVQVYGAAKEAMTSTCARLGIALHEFAWTPAARRAGFLRDAVYLVRPDGYLAFVSPNQDAPGFERFFSAVSWVAGR